MKKLVVFDFDGVLVDTTLICHQIHQEADPNFTFEHYKKMYHGNVCESFDRAKEEKKFIMPDNINERYIELTCDIGMPSIIHDCLAKLAEKYKLSIISSAKTSTISDILKRECADQHFDEILGCDVHKSKVFKFRELLEDHSILPQNSVFITDTLGDIREANEVGIPSIAVSWGVHDHATLSEGKPAAIIDKPEDLILTIEKILK